MNYKINRPPLTDSFDLPSHEELLKIKKGDHVKLLFQEGDLMVERMWLIVTNNENSDEWIGTLDNNPAVCQTLKYGMEIKFHPLDIIQIMIK